VASQDPAEHNRPTEGGTGEVMSGTLIIMTGVIYLYVSFEQGLYGNVGMAITYAAYAAANVGLWMMASK